MAAETLFNLFNIGGVALGRFSKLLIPLVIIFIAYIIVRWFQMVNKASHPDIVVIRKP